MKPWEHLVEDSTLSESKMREIRRLFRQAMSRPTDANLVALHQEMGYTRLAFDKWETILRRHPSNYAVRCFWLNAGKAADKETYIVNAYENCQPSWGEDEEPPDREVDQLIDNEKMTLDEVLQEAASLYVQSGHTTGSDWWESYPESEWHRKGQPECHNSLHVKYTVPIRGARLRSKGDLLAKDWARIDKAIAGGIRDADRVFDLDPFVP